MSFISYWNSSRFSLPSMGSVTTKRELMPSTNVLALGNDGWPILAAKPRSQAWSTPQQLWVLVKSGRGYGKRSPSLISSETLQMSNKFRVLDSGTDPSLQWGSCWVTIHLPLAILGLAPTAGLLPGRTTLLPLTSAHSFLFSGLEAAISTSVVGDIMVYSGWTFCYPVAGIMPIVSQLILMPNSASAVMSMSALFKSAENWENFGFVQGSFLTFQ